MTSTLGYAYNFEEFKLLTDFDLCLATSFHSFLSMISITKLKLMEHQSWIIGNINYALENSLFVDKAVTYKYMTNKITL